MSEKMDAKELEKLGRSVLDGLFVVRKVIGEGGMGLVLHVTHREWNVDLAVKIPKVEAVNKKGNRERFIQEAQTWIELGSHPHIVQCWYVRGYQGLPVLFLDYLQHGTIKDLLKSKYWRPQHWPGIIDLSLQMLAGLEYAHQNGVVHRDLKPANVLLRDSRHACITDFGLVKVMDTSLNNLEKEADTTTIGGTPLYASPEQWEGRVGPAVDIYSLGVIFYELCAGQVPFRGKNNLETILLHRTETPAPLSAPERLNAIVLKCLDKDPMKRPPLTEIRHELLGAFQEITGKTYPRPVPKPREQRATGLNNKALSLWSLGRIEPAFEAWDEACKIDGRHPQAVFNRALARFRRGELKEDDAIQQLHVAQAHAQMGFFLLEVGRYEQALEFLAWATNNSDQVERGLAHRALGDANMYLHRFPTAEHAYEAALKLMPNDQLTQGRLQLAKISSVQFQGRTFYPRLGPVCQDHAPNKVDQMWTDPRTGAVLSRGRGWLSCRHPQTGALLWRVQLEEEVGRLSCDLENVYALKGHQVFSLINGQVSRRWEAPLLGLCLERKEALVGDQLMGLNGQVRFALRKRFAAQIFRVAEFSSTEETLVTGSDDGWLEFWSLEDGAPGTRFRLEDRAVEDVALLEERRVVALTSSGKLHFWNYKKQEKTAELKGPFVSMARAGGYLILRGAEREFVVWDLAAHRPVFQGRGPVTFCAEGLLYIEDGRLSLWSLNQGWRLRRWEQHQQPISALTVTAGGTRVVTGGQRGLLQWWELDESNRVYLTEFQVARGASYTDTEKAGDAFAAAIQEFESQYPSDPQIAWDALQQARRVEGFARAEAALAGLARYYETCARVGLADLWEKRYLALDHLPYRVSFHAEEVATLDLHGNYRTFNQSGDYETVTEVGAFHQGLLGMLDGEFGEIMFDLPIQNLVTDKKAGRAVVATEEGHLHQVDLKGWKVLRTVPDQDHPTRIVVGAPGLDRVITGPTWHVWDFATGVHRKGPVAGGQIEAAGLSPDGQFAVTSNLDHRVQLWRLSDGHVCLDLGPQGSPMVRVQLWEHLNVVVTVASAGDLSLWDIADGRCLHSFQPHGGVIKTAWIGAAGRHIITVGADRNLRLWELEWTIDLERPRTTLAEQFAKKSVLKRLFSRG